MKNCSVCGLLKNESEFNKKNGMKDGLRKDCKACQSEYCKQRSKEKIQQNIIQFNDGYYKSIKNNKKQCLICNELKLTIEFYKDKSRNDGLNNKCKCCSDNQRQLYEHKPKKANIFDNNYYESIKDKIKICSYCNQQKPMKEFSKDKYNTDGVKTACSECCKQQTKNWQLNNIEHRRVYKQKYNSTHKKQRHVSMRIAALRRNYGLSKEQYDLMILKQNNECPICHNKFDEITHKPCVDHDHTTGKTRKILCQQCNFGLGRFYDNTTFLSNAINYLNLHTLQNNEI